MRLAALFLTSALALTGAASAQQAPAVAAAARANPAAWPKNSQGSESQSWRIGPTEDLWITSVFGCDFFVDFFL